MGGARYYVVEIVLMALLAGAVAYFGYLGYGLLAPAYALEPFSGERAEYYVAQQLEFGERTTASQGNQFTGDWLVDQLVNMEPGWDVVIQPFVLENNLGGRNIIAILGDKDGSRPVVVLSTHYDTRALADKDTDEEKRIQPAPGANAGGSGTAVLLELARTLDVEETGHTICLAFFDAEDNGGLAEWDYAVGSEEFVSRIMQDTPRCAAPRVAVYLDMVGAQGASIAGIAPDNQTLIDALREIAAQIGYENAFRGPHARDEMDALRRFADAGIPAVMLADMGYDYRHTTEDTSTKLSASTLQRVGDVLKAWLERGAEF